MDGADREETRDARTDASKGDVYVRMGNDAPPIILRAIVFDARALAGLLLFLAMMVGLYLTITVVAERIAHER